MTLMAGYIAHIFIPYTLTALPFWIIYAIINGTIATGLWVKLMLYYNRF